MSRGDETINCQKPVLFPRAPTLRAPNTQVITVRDAKKKPPGRVYGRTILDQFTNQTHWVALGRLSHDKPDLVSKGGGSATLGRLAVGRCLALALVAAVLAAAGREFTAGAGVPDAGYGAGLVAEEAAIVAAKGNDFAIGLSVVQGGEFAIKAL